MLGTNVAFIKRYGPTLVFQRGDGTPFGVGVDKLHEQVLKHLGLDPAKVMAEKAATDAAWQRMKESELELDRQRLAEYQANKKKLELERRRQEADAAANSAAVWQAMQEFERGQQARFREAAERDTQTLKLIHQDALVREQEQRKQAERAPWRSKFR